MALVPAVCNSEDEVMAPLQFIGELLVMVVAICLSLTFS